jgi:hypothetical protein
MKALVIIAQGVIGAFIAILIVAPFLSMLKSTVRQWLDMWQ